MTANDHHFGAEGKRGREAEEIRHLALNRGILILNLEHRNQTPLFSFSPFLLRHLGQFSSFFDDPVLRRYLPRLDSMRGSYSCYHRLPIGEAAVAGWHVAWEQNLEAEILQAFGELCAENAVDSASAAEGDHPGFTPHSIGQLHREAAEGRVKTGRHRRRGFAVRGPARNLGEQ